MRRIALSGILAILTAAALAQSPCQAAAALRVLIITPQPKAEPAVGIADLLSSEAITNRIVDWSTATDQLASGYDVLVLAGHVGPGEPVKKDAVHLAYGKPILGVGMYGCKYFGLLNLKNGWPYT